MAPTHHSPTPPPPIPHTPLKRPKMGFWHQVVSKKQQKKHKKTPETKKFFLDQCVNPSTALVTGV